MAVLRYAVGWCCLAVACTPLAVPGGASTPTSTPSPSPSTPTSTPSPVLTTLAGTVSSTVFDGNAYSAFYAECPNPDGTIEVTVRFVSPAAGVGWTEATNPGPNFKLVDLTMALDPNTPTQIPLTLAQLVSTDAQGNYALAPSASSELTGYMHFSRSFAPPDDLPGDFSGSSRLGGALNGNFVAHPSTAFTPRIACSSSDPNAVSNPNAVSDPNAVLNPNQ